MTSFLRPMLTLRTVATDATEKATRTFTVMSYNVLAQNMIHREWFAYASNSSLRWNKRKANFSKELAQINADIVCLQEVASYEDFWENTMRVLGYRGVMKQRPAGKHDGCAIFYKDHLFEEIGSEMIDYDDLCTGPKALDATEMRRHNVGMLLALSFKDKAEPNQPNGLIIGNTHLYWNYRYSYPRLRQSLMFLERAAALSGNFSFPIIMCGDWNITPDSTVYHVLTQGTIQEGVFDNFTYFGDEFEVAKLEDNRDGSESIYTPAQLRVHQQRVEHVKELVATERPTLPLLRSVYDTYSDFIPYDPSIQPAPKYIGEPPFTNFTDSFKGTLDYIFVVKGDTTLIPAKIMELPQLDLLQSQVALPNDMFSSDHVSIVCEFHM